MWWRMCEFAFGISARALVARELTTHLQGQPTRVLDIGVEYCLCKYRVHDGYRAAATGAAAVHIAAGQVRRRQVRFDSYA